MNFYKRRDCDDYQNELIEVLKLENLKKTAFALPNKKKLISIDFLGISATTLFDAGGNYAKTNVYFELKCVLDAHQQLAKEGYQIRIRLLFEYPYSISSYSRIQAEYTSDRASIEETAFSRKFNFSESLDIDLIKSSRYFSTQMASLIRIQSLIDRLNNLESWKNSKNKITLRFTAINPSFCCLFINDNAYYDVYLMAKKDRYHTTLEPFAPVCKINDTNDKDEMDAFRDHFRYVWDLDTTIHYIDATHYKPNVSNTLSKIKLPTDLTNNYRANRILSYNIADFSEEDAKKWSVISKKNILKNCADFTPTSFEEIMFVTCSWIKDTDSEPRPNNITQLLVSNWLNEDLNRHKKIIDFKILRASNTDYLDEQLYSGLDKATLALIILTKDIVDENGKYYCKPNVYHELGYLMNRLTHRKILILKEEGAILPSNVQNIPYISFTEDDLILQYNLILEAIRKMSGYKPEDQIFALENHLQRLQEYNLSDKLDNKSFKINKAKVASLIKSLKDINLTD